MLLFFSLFFQAVYVVYISLHLTFCTVQPNIAGEPPSPPNLSFFFEGYLPFVGWLQAARFPYSDALHIFPQNILRYFILFFCMQDAVPARPKQACISVDKYNMQDFFWNVLFFENFFDFFCELFYRKFSILFIAYTFECYTEV